MNIYETISFLQTQLKAGNTSIDDLLYKVNVEIDSYQDLSRSCPFVLIEADRTEFENSAGYGQPVKQIHYLSLTCVCEAQNENFISYKSAVNQLVKNTINKLITITDDDIQHIKPTELAHSEMMIGSLKTSAVVITLEVKTYWQDL
ncbi:MAG: hypothetical protein PHX51_07130 [Clostridia bacterium]|nr:hypothetical protein [Clostridia bacterium]